jgi:hypothetical protein
VKKKRLSKRQRANKIYIRIYNASLKKRQLKARQIARYERLSLSRTYFYLRYLKHSNVGPCLQKVGHAWIYTAPKREQAPGIVGGVSGALDETHDELVAEEDSPKIEYMEKFYAKKLRKGELTFHGVQTRINRITSLSLSKEEKAHILEHLA